MITETAMRNLEWLGDRYCCEHLREYDINELLNNPTSALRFVLASAFQRGRGFDLSNRYFNYADQVLLSRLPNMAEGSQALKPLANELSVQRIDEHINRVSDIRCDCLNNPPERNPSLAHALCPHLKEHSTDFLATNPPALPLNNSKDLKMVGGVIDLASRIGNILAQLNANLVQDGPLAAYTYLTTGEGRVRYIGEKIAALLIQDLCLLTDYRAADNRDRKELRGLFPVDTLVTRVAQAFRAPTNTTNAIKDFFIESCTTHNPAKIAAGIWYMARQPLALFVELCLPNCDFGAPGV